jgi:hypothetical protein
VLFSLPSFVVVEGWTDVETGEELKNWMAAQLVEGYQVPPGQAAALVTGGLILPILDGLDEMDPSPALAGMATIDSDSTPATAATTASPVVDRPRALAVVRALNTVRDPVVVACRAQEYHDLSHTPSAPTRNPPVLTDARHVTLRPLAVPDVIDYLAWRFGSSASVGSVSRLPNRWQQVTDAMQETRADGSPMHPDLCEVLTNPWQLFLAVTAYHKPTKRFFQGSGGNEAYLF